MKEKEVASSAVWSSSAASQRPLPTPIGSLEPPPLGALGRGSCSSARTAGSIISKSPESELTASVCALQHFVFCSWPIEEVFIVRRRMAAKMGYFRFGTGFVDPTPDFHNNEGSLVIELIKALRLRGAEQQVAKNPPPPRPVYGAAPAPCRSYVDRPRSPIYYPLNRSLEEDLDRLFSEFQRSFDRPADRKCEYFWSTYLTNISILTEKILVRTLIEMTNLLNVFN